MNYEKFKEAMNREDYSGMNEISAFALEQPERYERFREKWRSEFDEKIRCHNRDLTEEKFKNKPYMLR
ncbi:hypothetical protein NE634_14950 [Lacrimispora saccharolytica]|nr:hypothetical protein [Lacrimispora saccharolytica]